MISRSVSGGVTIALLIAYVYLAFMGVLVAAVLASTLVEGGWSIAVTIVTFLFAAGLALQGYERLARWRHVADLEPMFAGYSGERVPLFRLLSLADGEGEAKGEEGHNYSLGLARDEAFLLRDRGRDPAHRPVGGKLVHRRGRPVTFSRAALAGIAVIDRDDADIAAKAIDHRDYGERLGSAIAQAAMGTKIKTRIVPFASYLVLAEERPDGWIELVSAIPTEVDSDTLAALGARSAGPADDRPEGESIVALGSDPVHAAASAAGREMVGDEAADIAGGANDVLGAAGWLASPDAAAIGSTQGSRGRLMARLVARRLSSAAHL